MAFMQALKGTLMFLGIIALVFIIIVFGEMAVFGLMDIQEHRKELKQKEAAEKRRRNNDADAERTVPSRMEEDSDQD